MNRLASYAVLICLMFAGCTGQEVVRETPLSIPSRSSTINSPNLTPAVVEHTATLLPTSTSTSTSFPSPTLPLPTVTPALSPTPRFHTQCLNIAPDLTGKIVPGYALVYDFWGVENGPRYIYSFKSEKRVELPKNAYPIDISPDGNWLAYSIEDENTNWIVVETYDKKIQKQYLQQKGWYISHPFWLDQDRFRVTLLQYGVPGEMVVDAKTGRQTELLSEYPGLMPFLGLWLDNMPFDGGSVVYDPTLERVVYPKTVEGGHPSERFITLYNRVKETELASLKDQPDYPKKNPVWSLDGEIAIIVTRWKEVDEIYEVQRDGQVTQLTSYRRKYLDLTVSGVSISPDQQWLSFWVERPEVAEQMQLFLFNRETQEAMDVCIPANEAGRLTWSPDRRFLAVEQFFDYDHYQTILINVLDRWAVTVNDDAHPVGWLKEP